MASVGRTGPVEPEPRGHAEGALRSAVFVEGHPCLSLLRPEGAGPEQHQVWDGGGTQEGLGCWG